MQNAEDADTKLLEAIKQNQPHVVRELIRNGAVVNYRNSLGDTPLHFAALCGRNSIVQILIDAGANPKVKNAAGLSPYNVAANTGHWQIADSILRAAGGKRSTTRNPNTPSVGG